MKKLDPNARSKKSFLKTHLRVSSIRDYKPRGEEERCEGLSMQHRFDALTGRGREN